jgi:hypothetical protein
MQRFTLKISFPKLEGSLVELVGQQQPATCCVVGLIPAGSALEVWPWTSVLNRLVGQLISWAIPVSNLILLLPPREGKNFWNFEKKTRHFFRKFSKNAFFQNEK